MNGIKSIILMMLVNLLFVLMLSIILVIFRIKLNLISFALVFGFGGAFLSLFISKWLVKRMFKMVQISANDADIKKQLWDITVETANRSGSPMPELWIYKDNRPNAFAVGPSRSSAMIAVSTGLIDIMDLSSMKAVIGHEMGHIVKGDMLSTTLLMGLMNSYVIWLGNLVGRWLGSNFITDIVYTISVEICLSFLAMIPVCAFSRHREYAADAFSAKIWGAQFMINALNTLQEYPIKVNVRKEVLATSYINGGFTGLFATHPSTAMRVNRLNYIKKIQIES